MAVSPDGATVFVARGFDYQTLAYDASTGAKLWGRRYDGPEGESDNDYPHSITASPDGNRVFVTGGSYGTNGSGYATLAYDATTGNRLWLTRYDFKDYDNSSSARAIGVSPDGETVFVTGFSVGGPTDWDYATIAYDAATGAMSWEKRYNNPGDEQDAANALAISPDGSRVFVTGESRGLVHYDYATLAYDAVTGRRQWVKRYNGPGNGDDYSESIAVSPDGTGVFITGRSDFSAIGGDYETIAYDASTGAKRWADRFNGPSDSRDYATSIAASPDGSRVVVTGSSLASASFDDFTTIAYGA